MRDTVDHGDRAASEQNKAAPTAGERRPDASASKREISFVKVPSHSVLCHRADDAAQIFAAARDLESVPILEVRREVGANQLDRGGVTPASDRDDDAPLRLDKKVRRELGGAEDAADLALRMRD